MSDEISLQELKAARDEGGDLLLIDVREPHELEISCLSDVVAIPMAEVPDRAAWIIWVRILVVIC